MIRYGDSKLGWREVWLAASIVGLILPRAYLVSKFHPVLIDSDEAIVGLMARHILQGHLPIWYYGQSYMGSIEAAWTAVLFALFGSSPFVLKFAAFCWFCAFLPVQYFLAREIVGPFSARLNTLLLCASPGYLMLYSFKAMAGYMSVLFLGTVALLVSSRALNRGFSEWRAALLGFVLGLAWWTDFLAIVYIVPILIVLVLKFRSKLLSRAGGIFIVSFCLGSFPFWLYNLLRSWASFGLRSPHQEPFWPALLDFFTTVFPTFLGTPDLPYGRAAFLVWSSLGVLLFIAAVVLPLRMQRVEFHTKRILNGRLLLLVMLGLFPFIFAASGFGGNENVRYLIPLYSVIYILMLGGLRKSIQLALVAVLLIINLNGTLHTTVAGIATGSNAEPNAELIGFLRGNHVRTAYAPYWVAYRLTFESSEEVIATPTPRDLVRYTPYLDMARTDPAPAYIRLNELKYGVQNITPPSSYLLTRLGNFEVFLPPTSSE